jgi:hypothetical protein
MTKETREKENTSEGKTADVDVVQAKGRLDEKQTELVIATEKNGKILLKNDVQKSSVKISVLEYKAYSDT